MAHGQKTGLLYRQFSLQDSGLDSVGQDFRHSDEHDRVRFLNTVAMSGFRQENVAETDHYSVGPYFRHSHRQTSVGFSDTDSSVHFLNSFLFVFPTLSATYFKHYSVYFPDTIVSVF